MMATELRLKEEIAEATGATYSQINVTSINATGPLTGEAAISISPPSPNATMQYLTSFTFANTSTVNLIPTLNAAGITYTNIRRAPSGVIIVVHTSPLTSAQATQLTAIGVTHIITNPLPPASPQLILSNLESSINGGTFNGAFTVAGVIVTVSGLCNPVCTQSPTVSPTAAPTMSPTAPPTAVEASSAAGGGGGGGMMMFIIAAVAVVAVVVVVAILMRRKTGDAAAGAAQASRKAVDNPMYDASVEVRDNAIENPLYEDQDSDEEENQDGAYMDVGAETGSGYLDVDAYADEVDGGYMDVPSAGAYADLPEAEEGLYDDL